MYIFATFVSSIISHVYHIYTLHMIVHAVFLCIPSLDSSLFFLYHVPKRCSITMDVSFCFTLSLQEVSMKQTNKQTYIHTYIYLLIVCVVFALPAFSQTSSTITFSCALSSIPVTQAGGSIMNVPCTFQSSTPIEAVFLSCSSETTDVRCSFIPERLPHPDTQTPQTSFSPVLTIWLKRDLSTPWTKLHLSVKDARGRLLTTTSLSLVSIQSASTQERSLFNTLSTLPTPGILGPFRFNVLDNDTYILEPGESVTLRPEWLNTKSTDISSLTGTVSQFTSSVSGTTYTITDASASYGTIPRASSKNCEPDCYGVSIGVEPSDRPVHWDATILESLSNGTSRTWTIHIGKSFTDVPPQPAAPESQPSAREKWEKYRAVEIFIHKGFTSGCGGRNFCPNTILTRGMMAYFIGKARESTGSVYPTTGYLSHMTTTELNGRSEKYVCETNGSVYFDDVSPTGAFCPYIHGLFAQDVIDACDASPTSFCGSDQVTREEFALTLARAVAYGQDMIPRVVSSGPRTYNCTDG